MITYMIRVVGIGMALITGIAGSFGASAAGATPEGATAFVVRVDNTSYDRILLVAGSFESPPSIVSKKCASIVDCEAVLISTHQMDSLWMGRNGEPIDSISVVSPLDGGRVLLDGEVFHVRRLLDLADVASLLENPEGTVPIHRMRSATGHFQGPEIAALAARIRSLIQARETLGTPID